MYPLLDGFPFSSIGHGISAIWSNYFMDSQVKNLIINCCSMKHHSTVFEDTHWSIPQTVSQSCLLPACARQNYTNYYCVAVIWMQVSMYPLVNQHSYWKLPFVVDLPIKIVIFHSYVSLPEGIVGLITKNMTTTFSKVDLQWFKKALWSCFPPFRANRYISESSPKSIKEPSKSIRIHQSPLKSIKNFIKLPSGKLT